MLKYWSTCVQNSLIFIRSIFINDNENANDKLLLPIMMTKIKDGCEELERKTSNNKNDHYKSKNN